MDTDHDPYAALRLRDYRYVLGGSVVASVGMQMQNAALDWELIVRTEGDTRTVGWVGLVQFLPVLLLSLPAGHAVDRFNRKVVLIAAQTAIALAAVGLAVLSFTDGPIPLFYVCLLLTGIGRAFSAPARWALVPLVVPGSLLSNAVTWNSSGWQIASVAGPALAGLVIWFNVSWSYVVTAATAIACAVLVGITRPRPQERSPMDRSLTSLLDGVRFVWRTKPILATITLDLFAVLFGGATALLAVYSQKIIEVDATGYGWLRAAPALGAFVMAIALAHLPPLRRPGITLLWSVAGFGVATIVFGLSRDFTLSFIMLALTGAFDNVSVVVRGTLVQVLTPDPMRGRVSAVNSVFIGSSNELGAYESGETAYWFGPVASVVGGGVATIVVVISTALRWPELLRLGPLHKVGRRDAATGEDVGCGEGTSGWGGPDGARAILGDGETEDVEEPGR